MAISLKCRLNMLILLALCLLLTTILLKPYSIIPGSATSILSTASPKVALEDFVPVPLKEIMRSPVTLPQDNVNFIKVIRNEFLVPPSQSAYNLYQYEENPSKGQATKILNLLGPKKNGFFIECGALDGETRSNTLVFEKVHKWQGVLIEGDPKNFNLILKKNRKAWAVPACLSIHPYPNVEMFSQRFNLGRISGSPIGASNPSYNGMTEVQCLPVYSILLALNRTTVDYFSLDVEGHELEVLKTIPWDKVNITTLSVEFIHGRDGKEALKRYMEFQGYRVYTEVTSPGGMANDFIFYHPHLLPEERLLLL